MVLVMTEGTVLRAVCFWVVVAEGVTVDLLFTVLCVDQLVLNVVCSVD